MATNVKQFPQTVISGDTLNIELVTSTYQTSDYTLIVQFYGPSGNPAAYTYAQTGSPTSFTTIDDTKVQFKLAPVITAAFGVGAYTYSIIATDGTDQYTIETGVFTVCARAADLTATDTRSHYVKTLSAINATIENRATKDQASFTIACRTLQRIPLLELLQLRDYYAEKVLIERGPRRTKMFVHMRGA